MNCAKCNNNVCVFKEKTPPHAECPMNDTEFFEDVKKMYHEEENARIYGVNAPKEGRAKMMSRMDFTIQFLKSRGYKKIGVAFCNGMSREGKLLDAALRKAGFETVAVGCKVGGFDFYKDIAGREDDSAFGIVGSPDDKAPTHGKRHIACCDPIGQALLLNRENVEFNVVIGLCVGHDSLFLKHADAPCTVFATKDRMYNHVPCSDLYAREGFGLLD